MYLKYCDGMVNSVESNQTAWYESTVFAEACLSEYKG